MTHEQVLTGDVVDGYVQGTLSAADRAAFEEHMFTCDECFAQVGAADRLRSAVKELARRGELSDAAPAPVPMQQPAASPSRTMRYAPWLAFAATLAIAATSVVLQQRRYDDLRVELEGVRDRHGALRLELDRVKSDARERARGAPEANLPVAILQTSRSAAARTTVTLPPNTSRFVVWIEDPPQTLADVVMTLADPSGATVARLSGLRANAQGAVVASFPAASVPSGSYLLRLTSGDRRLAEYPLSIVRLP